jgi:hypothetical protein
VLPVKHKMWATPKRKGKVARPGHSKTDLEVSTEELAAQHRAAALAEELGVAAPAGLYQPSIRWLADTGSGHDLISYHDLTELDKIDLHEAGPLELNTANGITVSDRKVPLQIAPLLEEINCRVLDSTAPVLSIGRRCMEEGYCFVWNAGQAPVLHLPSGKKVNLEVDGYVPYLRSKRAEACPASSSSSSGDKIPTAPHALQGAEAQAPEQAEPVAAEAAAEPQEEDEGGVLGKPSGKPLKEEALSLRHLMTHMPKNPYCEACQRAKAQNKPARASHRAERPNAPKNFGEQVSADHIILGDGDGRAALVLRDVGTGWLQCIPLKDKTADETYDALKQFMGPKGNIQELHSDAAPEIIRAAKDLGLNHTVATPGRPDSKSCLLYTS